MSTGDSRISSSLTVVRDLYITPLFLKGGYVDEGGTLASHERNWGEVGEFPRIKTSREQKVERINLL